MFFFKNKNKNISKTLEISYQMNSGIPFKWEFKIKNNKIVEFVKQEVIGEKTKEPICGGNITIKYIFKGIKPGKTKIIFKLVNFADNYTQREEEYNIQVDNSLNIKTIK